MKQTIKKKNPTTTSRDRDIVHSYSLFNRTISNAFRMLFGDAWVQFYVFIFHFSSCSGCFCFVCSNIFFLFYSSLPLEHTHVHMCCCASICSIFIHVYVMFFKIQYVLVLLIFELNRVLFFFCFVSTFFYTFKCTSPYRNVRLQ